MNKKLEQRLDEHFYSDSYGSKLEDTEGIKEATEKYYEILEPTRKQNFSLFFELEAAIGAAEIECERRGFHQGYQYALEMLGLSK